LVSNTNSSLARRRVTQRVHTYPLLTQMHLVSWSIVTHYFCLPR
jgi:hypothetical protein